MANLHSKIILVKDINLDREYINVLSYTEKQMLELCRSNKIKEADNYQFIRPTNSLYTNFKYSDCLKANYIAFQNPDYDNKWFFAFVDDVIYQGEENTEITFTVDSWSTWYGKWTKKPCYVIRHHVNNDTIGLHTVPENLDVGEVVCEYTTEDASYTSEYGYWIAINSSWDIHNQKQYSGVCVYDNTVFGSQLYLFNIVDTNDFLNVVLFLYKTSTDGHIADVQNMFILPDVAIELSKLNSFTESVGGQSFSYYTMQYDMDIESFDTTISKRHSFSGISVKNNKCFVYPYNYLYVTNNQGSNNIYKYENFSGSNCVFKNQFAISIGGSGRVVPLDYKGMSVADDESLSLGKYPTCGWSSDAFTNWLTQNAVNIPVSLGLTGGNIASSIATGGATTGNVAGATMSIASSIGNLIGQFYQASLLPNINGGQALGDVLFSANRNLFSFKEMRAKNEYMKIIDDYFTRYGYKIMELVSPNLTGRAYWNYVEIGSNEDIGYGDVPTKYMEEINRACRKGVTIWHNHSSIGNYSLNNTIV